MSIANLLTTYFFPYSYKPRYDIFTNMNVSIPQSQELLPLADLFQLIGQPIRIQILLVIGDDEACVCHLEAVTGIRQAVISQHLMLLRKAGLVTPNRDGRNIYYRLKNPSLISMIKDTARAIGIRAAVLTRSTSGSVPNCPCPKCTTHRDCGKRSGK
jgi:DNA-binding transcriptional ArsR family regulator